MANQFSVAKLHSLCPGKLEHEEPLTSHSRTTAFPFTRVLTRNPGVELKAATSELGSSKLRSQNERSMAAQPCVANRKSEIHRLENQFPPGTSHHQMKPDSLSGEYLFQLFITLVYYPSLRSLRFYKANHHHLVIYGFHRSKQLRKRF